LRVSKRMYPPYGNPEGCHIVKHEVGGIAEQGGLVLFNGHALNEREMEEIFDGQQ